MVSLSDKPSESENRSSTVKKVTLLATGFVGLSMTVIACCGGLIYGVSEMSRQIGESIGAAIGAGIAEMLEQSADAALRDTQQITEIAIPDLFIPLFGSSYGTNIPVELEPEIALPDGIDEAILPDGSDIAIYIVPVKKPGLEQNLDNEVSSGGLFLIQVPEAEMSKKNNELWTDFKRMLQLAESTEKDKEANESLIIRRSIRDEPATFLLSRKLEDDLGGKEAWILLGFFRGKESPACIFMSVNTDRMEKEQILEMIDSIR